MFIIFKPRLEDHLVDTVGNSRQLHITDLQHLLDQLPIPYILIGDFNAKNPLWGSSLCDRWSAVIEQLIEDNDAVLLNDGSKTRYDVYHN